MTMGRAGILFLAVLWLSGCAATMPGNVYDSADEPKALGVHLRVIFPEDGWERGSGDDGSVIVEFTRRKEAHVEMLMLQVQDIEEAGARFFFPVAGAESQQLREASWKKTIDSRPDTKLVFVSDTVVSSGRPAVMTELVSLPSGSKEDIYIRLKMLYVYEKGRLVVLTCGAGSEMEKRAGVD
ncbi:MAG: hypothetical protein GX776_03215, partial [Oxalobacter sp.]|nr:hypothetical protein [Oxalobacter sp.]